MKCGTGCIHVCDSPVSDSTGVKRGSWVVLADLEGEISGAYMLILGYSPVWGARETGGVGVWVASADLEGEISGAYIHAYTGLLTSLGSTRNRCGGSVGWFG